MIGETLQDYIKTAVQQEIQRLIAGGVLTVQGPAQPVKLALTVSETACALSVHRNTVWKLCATGELVKTSYGVIPIESINAHLAREIKKGQKRSNV